MMASGCGAVAGSSEPHDRLDPDVTGDVVVNVDVGPVDLTTKTMHVWDGSTLVLETQTTIGAPGTPTRSARSSSMTMSLEADHTDRTF